MTHLMSGLMSWMKGLFVKKTSDSDLKRWAQTEYGNDWQAAYQQMKTNPGKVPTLRGVYQ